MELGNSSVPEVAFATTVDPAAIDADDIFERSGVYHNPALGVYSTVSLLLGAGFVDSPLTAQETRLIQAVQNGLEDQGAFSTVIGRVGTDVVNVVLHTYTGGDVVASISDGWYTAWWPGLFGGQHECLIMEESDGSNTEYGCDIVSEMTLTFADGSTESLPNPFDRDRRNMDVWGALSVPTD